IERSNHMVTDFILLGFTTDPVIQLVLFVVFLGVYSVTLLRNNIPIMLICSDAQLHTFLYFFTGNLSFLDLLYSSVYNPNILVTCFSEDKSISFCRLCDPILLLCNAQDTDIYLVVFSYTGGFLSVIILTSYTFTLDFCDDYIIDDFFCDLVYDVRDSYQPVLYFLLPCNVTAPTLLILASFLFIIAAILRIHSTQGCLKAFSIFSTHLVSVTLYYSSILYIYFCPNSSCSLVRDKVVSTFYTMLFLILRNKEVKEALKKLF
uniref:G-protein coupled receptors family 1 profile domain-containing protein n=1 Tax=Cavia porcellus TaxID=10141 RepID=A0A286Y4R4_CAVPO